MELTKEQLEAIVAERIKATYGMTPDDFKKEMEELKAMRAAHTEQRQQRASDDLYGANLESEHPYLQSARHVVNSDRKKGLGLRVGRALRAIGLSHKERNASPEDIATRWGDKWLAEDLARTKSPEYRKALAGLDPTSNISSGGALVPVEYMQELIELLRSASIVRASGARILPMETGTMNIPKKTGGATAAYVAENANHTSTSQTFGQVVLTAKKLIASTPVSNDLLRSSDPSADQVVRDDLLEAMASRQDLAFIRESASATTPTGIRNLVAAGTQLVAQSGVTVAAIVTDLFAMIEAVEGANHVPKAPVWYMTSRAKNGLMSLFATNEWFVFKDEMVRGTLLGFPFFVSNQIPKTLGGGNESEIYFGDASEILIGDTRVMELSAHDGGTYYDGSNLVSGIAQDQTVIKVVSTHDCALRHDTAFAVKTGDTLGA